MMLFCGHEFCEWELNTQFIVDNISLQLREIILMVEFCYVCHGYSINEWNWFGFMLNRILTCFCYLN